MAVGQTEDGIVFEYQDGTDPTKDAGLRTAIASERARRRNDPTLGPQQKQFDKDRQTGEIDRQINSMGPLKRAGTNVAVGIDNAVVGARQLGAMVGLGKGVSDEEIAYKRQFGDRLAAKSDMGVLPDWVPTAGKAAQFVGEMAPTLVPGGVAASAVGKVLPKAMQLGRRGAAIADAAIMGGVSGALQPTLSTESRGANVAAGAAGGAVLPGAMAAYRGAQNMLARGSGLQRRVGDRYVREMGEDGARQFADDLTDTMAGRSGVAADVPLSAAELAKLRLGMQGGDDAALRTAQAAMIERQARPASGPEWTAFRDDQTKASAAALRQIGTDARAGEIDLLKAERDAVSGPLRENALTNAQASATNLQPLSDTVAQIHKESPANGYGEKVAGYFTDQFAKDTSPEALYGFRKMLASRMAGPSTDDMSLALRSANRETMRGIRAIDDHLDQGTGDWMNYLSAHSDASKPVDNARAAKKLLEYYFDRDGAKRGMSGDPAITLAGFGNAVDRFDKNPWGSNFTTQTRGQLDDLTRTLRAAGVDDDFRRGAGGNGSDTGLNNVLMNASGGALDMLTGNGVASRALAAMGKAGNSKERVIKGVSDAAMNPEKVVQAIQAKLLANQPLTAAEHALWQSLGASTAGALTAPSSE
jgi:hypothetical protein